MAGSLSLALGVAGIFVPLLPTTPFLLLSAALYMRSSPRLYDWLLRQPCLGAYIRDFRENRAIPLRAKVVSVVLVWLSIGYCILRVVDAWRWGRSPSFCSPQPSRVISSRSRPGAAGSRRSRAAGACRSRSEKCPRSIAPGASVRAAVGTTYPK